MEQRQAQRGLDRRRAQVRVDPLEDRLEAVELARRVEVEQLVDELVVPVERREALVEEVPGVAARMDRFGAVQVVLVDRRVALLAAAQLVAADDAAVVLAQEATPRRPAPRRAAAAAAGRAVLGRHDASPERRRRPRRRVRVVVALALGLPDELVDDGAAAAGRAARREGVADRHAQAGLAARRGAEGLERRVEVAHVGRPQDDLGEEPGQRVRLHRDGPPLAVDGGPGHPAAPPVQVDDDVTGRRVALDGRGDEVGRRRRTEALERRERDRRVGAGERVAGDHGPGIVPPPPGRRPDASGIRASAPRLPAGSSRAGRPRIDRRGPTARRARRAPLRTPRPW